MSDNNSHFTKDIGLKKDPVVGYNSDTSVITSPTKKPATKTAVTTNPGQTDSQPETTSQICNIFFIDSYNFYIEYSKAACFLDTACN